MIPHIRWFSLADAEKVDDVVAETPALLTVYRDLVVIGITARDDGGYDIGWNLAVAPGRPLPDIEAFLTLVAEFIVDEPIPHTVDELV